MPRRCRHHPMWILQLVFRTKQSNPKGKNDIIVIVQSECILSRNSLTSSKNVSRLNFLQGGTVVATNVLNQDFKSQTCIIQTQKDTFFWTFTMYYCTLFLKWDQNKGNLENANKSESPGNKNVTKSTRTKNVKRVQVSIFPLLAHIQEGDF